MKECERRGVLGGVKVLSQVGVWAFHELGLNVQLSYATAKLIIADPETVRLNAQSVLKDYSPI